MSYTAREYLAGLKSFTRHPASKEEVWRFSKLKKWLDKSYGDTKSYSKNKKALISTQNYISVHNGTVEKESLPNGVEIESRSTALQSEHNPYLGLINDLLPKTQTLTCKKSLIEPLLINYSYDNNSILASSIEIHVEKGVEVEIVEYFEGASESFLLHGTSVKIESSASVRLRTVQNLESDAILISHTKQTLAPHSTLKEFHLYKGSGFHQHFIESDLYMGANNELNALTSAKETQNHLLSTIFTHKQRDTVSVQKAKELLRGKSIALFDGRSIILNEATNSDVRQENRGLLLSKEAQLHAKPHLEIFTDDLSASHGATVGELDIEALNYLQTRGINEEEARKMLINAFIDDLLLNIDNEELLIAIRKLLEEGGSHEEF